ncbi:MAG: hypothetical protein OJJ21_09040 [Ferrovibrio sp.]|uniref:DUF4886 domain-containing protein n=1 Tax=Ferrovibrio sp. TaxID=1917215 RepID=UPI0026254B48|nr:DUF4886 domain-containing protein [Ferrovibrio sp.]MCW0233729.1 hypothetical protein [Ferrovibrio sp.]
MSLRQTTLGMMKLGIAAALLLSVTATAGWAQTRPTVKDLGAAAPASVIFIGNSFFYYNNSMHGHVTRMVSEGMKGHKYRNSSVTISGSGLDWHDVESYFRPNGIGKYSFVGDNEVVFNPPADKLFEVAVMMDCSQCPVHPTLSKSFTEYTKKHSDTVRKHGGKPVFFMSWAYQDKPEMTAQLAEAYTVAGNANNALVIPAGLAFANSIRQKPDLNLYVADKRHPSLAGTYLAAATTYAALFGKSPVGLKYDAALGADTAAHLQKVAQDTVQQYLAR